MRRHPLTSLVLFVLAIAPACDDDLKTAQTVEPVYGDPCEFQKCGLGICKAKSETEHECLCPLGYAGLLCESCEPDFHRDSLNRCVSDKRCAEQVGVPCGTGGECIEEMGVLSCRCDEGYEGPRCQLCADRYERDHVDRCIPLYLGQGKGGDISCPPGHTGLDCSACETGYHKMLESCVLDEECKPNSCPPNGLCAVADGAVTCTCEAGYSGASCSRCAAGMHFDDNVCVPDQVCAADSCPANAACSVLKGRILCSCMVGYEGSDCSRCAPGYRKDGTSCALDNGGCPTGQHAQDGGTCVPNPFCELASCPEHATCDARTGQVVCACDPGWSPTGKCDTCAQYGTERSGFEFPTGWSMTDNQCQQRSELSVSLITFRSRTGPDGKPDSHVSLCARSTFSKMSTQHIELQSYQNRPATMVFEREATLIAFDFGARLEPLALDVFAYDSPAPDMSTVGREIAKIDLGPLMRSTFTIPLAPAARAIALRSRNGKLQYIALDDLVFHYADCE